MVSIRRLDILALLACLMISGVRAQSLRIERRIPISGPVTLSANQYDNLFVGDVKGTIRVYDSTGTVLNSFSPPQAARVTALEAWQGLRVFCFYADLQEYTMLDRFLTPQPGYSRPLKITAEQVGFARLATLASDGQLWLFDDTDFSLKKYNPITRQVSLRVPLELVIAGGEYHFSALREYQNLVFLQDSRSGVLIFDNAGNFRSKVAHPPTGTFGLSEDELYFTDAGQLVFIHLYNQERRRISLPEGSKALSVTVGTGKIFILTEKEIVVCPKGM